mgnify:CR=1 FL=1
MTGGWKVPFNRPFLAGGELEYIRQAVEAGHISGGGGFTRKCEELLRRELSAAAVLLTTSGTHALEMAALLLDIQPGDEVVVPSFTFVSTANAFALRGARLVFSDIRPDTLNMDEQRLPELIGERTRAVVPVHYAGVACSMEEIVQLCGRRRVPVVEDNAHGLFADYRDKPLGSFGCMSALSFHETKNLTCGEGGALVVNDRSLLAAAEVVRDKGTDRSRFFRGEVDRYTWVALGSSYQPSDMLAAFLLAQLEERRAILRRRLAIWNRYMKELEDWASRCGARLPIVPEDAGHSAHIFYLIMPDSGSRDGLIEYLRTRGILAVFHYQPLHLSSMAPGESSCPVTEDIAGRIVRLPLFPDMEPEEQDIVLEAVGSFRA